MLWPRRSLLSAGDFRLEILDGLEGISDFPVGDISDGLVLAVDLLNVC
jgi:hypothetical protein